ncbi:cell wall associated protein [Purpureocillium lavendulum]|uniref:Cell wall associated protein n=1 Tax=Purpureocillium lavendulum TaxID=1247861 RepID=A0AB34FUH0_9HYPO|nr:cell wall associated protein [Purpureocillium lavendulum]
MRWGLLGFVVACVKASGVELRDTGGDQTVGPTLTVKVQSMVTSTNWEDRAVTVTVYYNGPNPADRITVNAGNIKSISLVAVDDDQKLTYSAKLWTVDDIEANTTITRETILQKKHSGATPAVPIIVTAYTKDSSTGHLRLLKTVEAALKWDRVSYKQKRPHAFPQPRTILVAALPDAEGERVRLRQPYLWADFTPSGFYLNPGNAVRVKISTNDATTLTPPEILVGTPGLINRLRPVESSPSQLERHVFERGQDELSVVSEEGGIIYIRHAYRPGEKPPPPAINVTIYGEAAQPFPFFQEGITTNSEWKTMLQRTTVPYAEISGERIIVTGLVEEAKAAAARNHDDGQEGLLRTYKAIIAAQDAISGLHASEPDPRDRPSPLRQMVVQGKWDYLARGSSRDYRVAITNYLAGEVWSSNLLSGSWTIWHELGRQRLHKDTWIWSAAVNITVDIYSLAVGRVFPRIRGGRWRHGSVEEWKAAEEYLSSREQVFDVEENIEIDPYTYKPLSTRLVMFEQLRVAFGDDFYPNLHKRSRRAPVQASEADKKHVFMTQVADIARRDLSEFFVKWGLLPERRTMVEMSRHPMPDRDYTMQPVYRWE